MHDCNNVDKLSDHSLTTHDLNAFFSSKNSKHLMNESTNSDGDGDGAEIGGACYWIKSANCEYSHPNICLTQYSSINIDLPIIVLSIVFNPYKVSKTEYYVCSKAVR